jgi:hypothetical protein
VEQTQNVSDVYFIFTTARFYEELQWRGVDKLMDSEAIAALGTWISRGIRSLKCRCGYLWADHVGYSRCLFDNATFHNTSMTPEAYRISERAVRLMIEWWWRKYGALEIKGTIINVDSL